MKRSGGYEQDVLCIDHPVLRVHICSLDDRQEVALNAFAGDIRVAAGFPAGDLVDLIEKNDARRLDLFKCVPSDLLHIDETFLFFAKHVPTGLGDLHLPANRLRRKEIAEHVPKIHAHLLHSLPADEIDCRVSSVLGVDVDKAVVEFAAFRIVHGAFPVYAIVVSQLVSKVSEESYGV